MNTTNKPLFRTLLASTLIAGLSLLFGTAWAQGRSANTGPDSATKPASAGSVSKTNVTTLTSVIVTAEKRTQDAHKVPASISVVSAEQLQHEHVGMRVNVQF